MHHASRKPSLNSAIYAAIDKLRLYESALITFSAMAYPVTAERLRSYYHRTGKTTIRAHPVVDGIVVVRVE